MTELRQASPVLVLVDHPSRDGRFLLEWHETWKCFMFPVTTIRHFDDPVWGMHVVESPVDAALRAAAVATGLLLRKNGLRRLASPLSVTSVSAGQGQLTGYHVDVFRYGLSGEPKVSHPVQWLALDDVVNENLGPISTVARAIATRLLEIRLEARTPAADEFWQPVAPVL